MRKAAPRCQVEAVMPIEHRHIPVLPERPRVHPIDDHIRRSYSSGRQSFSRAYQGEVLTLTITSTEPMPDDARVCLTTTMNSATGDTWVHIPFERVNERTLTCRVLPKRTGLHSFRAEFSMGDNAPWLRDTVPDSWVLVDPPQVDALRIYTLIPTVSGRIADWKADLKRVSGMGFNAVHLMPVTLMDTSESPYAAKNLFALDYSYLAAGSREDGLAQLEDYIGEAKSLGIQLCFDLVLNHVGVHSAMASRAPDWIVPDQNQPDGLQRAGYWLNRSWRTWDDLVLINYEHPSEAVRSEIRAYMTEYALFWARYASDTGGFVRLDNLHSSNPNFMEALTEGLHSAYPEVGVLAEYFTDDHTLLNTVPKWGLNLLLATPWDHKFAPDLRDYLNYIHSVSAHVRYYMPVTSHDCGAPAQEFGTADSTVPRYVAAALLGTGATGIPQGVEFGEAERVDFIGRWPKAVYPAKGRFALFISQVNAILAEYGAFRHGGNCQFVDNGHPAIIAAFRRGDGTQTIGFLVACNFDTSNAQEIEIDLTAVLGANAPFTCTELLSGETRSVSNSSFTLQLERCSAQVLRFSRSGASAGERISP